jgi:PadR family transcriptional regulator PadR
MNTNKLREDTMNLLSRSEEIVLLSVWKLQGNAYGPTIRRIVSQITGRPWSIGALYAPLHRLERKRLVKSIRGDPKPERGGRSRTYYELTSDGKKALLEIRSVLDAAWEDVPALNVDEA